MTFDNIEQPITKIERPDISSFLKDLNSDYDSRFEANSGYFNGLNDGFADNIASWLDGVNADTIRPVCGEVFNEIKTMFSGTSVDGKKPVGLYEINNRYLKTEGTYANVKQQAGYAAEIINAAKENVNAIVNNSDVRTIRTDDIPKNAPETLRAYTQNDPYVDLLRIDSNNNVMERVQVKYVGKNASDCLCKLTSKKYDKYLDTTKVDKIQVPKEFYDDIKKEIPNKIKDLEEQIERCKQDGKNEVAETKAKQVEKLQTLDNMLEPGSATTQETINATKHPKIYNMMLTVENIAKAGHAEGLEAGKMATITSLCISTVSNIRGVYTGEVSAEDAVVNIVKTTGTAAVMGYGTGFVTGAVSTAMRQSSHELIKAVGGSCLPAAAVSMAIESYDEVIDFVNGDIDGYEFAEKMGENASMVAGGMAGASIGSVGGPVGMVVGGVVGCAVSSTAYQNTVEYLKENGEEIIENTIETAELVSDKVVDFAEKTVETALETAEIVNEVALEAVDYVVDKATDIFDETSELIKNTGDVIVEKIDGIKEETSSIINDVKTGTVDNLEKVGDAISETYGYIENGAEELAKQASEMATSAIEAVSDFGQDTVDTVKDAFNSFASSCSGIFSF